MPFHTRKKEGNEGSISTMKKRAKELKDGYNKWIVKGKEMPVIPTIDQSKFLEQGKNNLTLELTRKEDANRIRKHENMAPTGTQFLQKEESVWFWAFLNLPYIKERCKENAGSKRGLLRQLMLDYPILCLLVERLLERKVRHNKNANQNNVLDTLIASWTSFEKHSRF